MYFYELPSLVECTEVFHNNWLLSELQVFETSSGVGKILTDGR